MSNVSAQKEHLGLPRPRPGRVLGARRGSTGVISAVPSSTKMVIGCRSQEDPRAARGLVPLNKTESKCLTLSRMLCQQQDCFSQVEHTLEKYGIYIAAVKIQSVPPWKYLGWRILQKKNHPAEDSHYQ